MLDSTAEIMAEDDNVINLEARRKAVQPKRQPPHRDNWLTRLNPGCLFLSKSIGSPLVTVDEFSVIRHVDDYTLLMMDLNEPSRLMWVESLEFSTSCELKKILREKEE